MTPPEECDRVVEERRRRRVGDARPARLVARDVERESHEAVGALESGRRVAAPRPRLGEGRGAPRAGLLAARQELRASAADLLEGVDAGPVVVVGPVLATGEGRACEQVRQA